jgi:hypothetical protein
MTTNLKNYHVFQQNELFAVFNKMNFFVTNIIMQVRNIFAALHTIARCVLSVDRSVKEYRQVLDIVFRYLTKGGFNFSVCRF